MNNIVSKIDNGVLLITMNRANKLNAITVEMYDVISELMTLARQDCSIRCVLISGGDDVFTAGNDLKDFLQKPPSAESGGVMRFLSTLAHFPKPLGAAVSGIAVGVGVTLLFHCDFVVATGAATFSAPFVDLGLVPEAGSTYLAPRQLGQKAANRLFLLGEAIDAQQALDIGLISHVVNGSAVDAALQVAERVASRSPQAVLETKRLMQLTRRDDVLKQIDEEGRVFEELVKSDYCRALFKQFLGE